ncbi:3-galactosyl-N-acetylglucosaminide 4-alpha-L-fucosyltransferase FUT3-like [Amblyomma americanum]
MPENCACAALGPTGKRASTKQEIIHIAKACVAHPRAMQRTVVGACFLCASMIVFVATYTDLKCPDWAAWAFVKERFQKPVKILFWTKAHRSWEDIYHSNISGLTPHDNCPVPCFLTNNRSLIRAVDAVVIHDRDANGGDLPKYRAAHQRWVYWNLEAPPNSRRRGMQKLRRIFNWTYTYRRDSDVWHPYFFVRRLTQTGSNAPDFVTPTNRSRLVVWAVSNCEAPSGRMDFVNELKKYIPVDIYGKCGDMRCPHSPECSAIFGQTYYFSLALENSICPEYVTEKFYEAVNYGMVPVVLGNYSDFVPPNSYINAFDFHSPKHLAAYLKALAADQSRYKAYFAWRRTHDIELCLYTNHCALCEALYKARPGNRRVYKDIIRWWHGRRPLCTSWKPATTRTPGTRAPAGRTVRETIGEYVFPGLTDQLALKGEICESQLRPPMLMAEFL